MTRRLPLALLALALHAQPDPAFFITTIAGTGRRGWSGDGGAATAAQIALGPGGIAADSLGNIYFVDGGVRIRKVTPAGIITTIATLAAADAVGLATDSAGNLYIAEDAGCRIEKLRPQSVPDTIAGKGCGFGGDGFPAAGAQLLAPRGLAVDSNGNLHIADSANQRVRRITADGVIRTVAGSGVRGFGGDNGAALAAALHTPSSAALDGTGNLYIADLGNYRIRRVSPGGLITTYAGAGADGFGGDGGPAVAAQLSDVRGLALDAAGHLYLADSRNQRIRSVAPNGTMRTVAGSGVAGFSGDGGPATAARFRDPYDIAAGPDGSLYVLDANNHRIRKLAPLSSLVPCATVSLVPSALEVGAAGAAGTIAVSVSPAGCVWTAAATAPWLTITSDAGGAGNANISYTVAPNASVETRRAAISVGSAATSFIQQGVCSYALDPSTASYSEAGGPGSLAVRTPYAFCAWTAASSAAWLVITSPARGTGIGSIAFQVHPNPAPEPRRATIFVGSGAQGGAFVAAQSGAARSVAVASVVNAAGFTAGMSPGSWISIFGENLAPIPAPGRAWRSEEIRNGAFPTSLDGVSVRIDNQPAFLSFVGPAQLNVQVPDTETLGPVAIEVSTPAGSSRLVAEMRRVAPALFVIAESQGRRYAAAVHLNGILAGRPDLVPGSRPARPGDIVLLFGTGFGPTSPARPAGRLIEPAPLSNTFTVRIGGLPALTYYGGLVAAGLNQFNVQLPDLPSGEHAVVIETAGAQTQAGVFVPVER